MKNYISKIIPDEDTIIEVKVIFHPDDIDSDINSLHPHAEVTIFLEKKDLSLSEIKTLSIQKAHEFLSRVVASH